MRTKKTILFFILFFSASLTMNAGMMGIAFDEMISKCSKIVIAKYIDSDQMGLTYRIEVESVLKGKADSKIITVGRAWGAPDVQKGKRFVAFINESDSWEWVGNSDNIETGIISMNGFYDYDGYAVYPSGITLVQLKQYISENKFDGSMEGNLAFFNYQTRKNDNAETSFSVSYTYYSNKKVITNSSWKGLTLVDFTSKPKIGIWGDGCRIEFESNTVRPLIIDGSVDSVYAGGKKCHSTFYVSEPADLDKESFYQYLAHPEYGQPAFELEFVLSDSTKYSFTTIEESGSPDYLTYGNKTLPCQSCGQSTKSNKGGFKFGEIGGETQIEIVLDLLPNEKRFEDYFYDLGSLKFIPSLRTAPWKGEFFVLENGKMKSRGRCIVRLKKMTFTKNENYKK